MMKMINNHLLHKIAFILINTEIHGNVLKNCLPNSLFNGIQSADAGRRACCAWPYQMEHETLT